MAGDKNHGVIANPDQKLAFDYFIFEEHAVGRGGLLPDFERGAHACWYYCVCAHANLASVSEGAIYEGELDTHPALNNIARSVALQYQLNDPSEFVVFMPLVIQEAIRSGLGWDPKVLNAASERFKYVI